MPVTDITTDPENLTMTLVADAAASVDRLWNAFTDPRQLERWWGPPTYPATVEEHDLRPGGKVTYFMTGPEGDTPRGYWDVLEVQAPRMLTVKDGFADDDGTPLDGMGITGMRMDIVDRAGGGVVMTLTSTFSSLESLEQMLAMGMEAGLREAMGQIDGLLAA